MEASAKTRQLAGLVGRFMGEMHRYDGGRTLPLLHAAKLTMAQLAVLEYAGVTRTVSEIAAYAGLSRPATSFMIEKLVRRGYVRRSEGVVDRRERAIVRSAKGDALLERIQAARVRRFEASLAVLPSRVAGRLRGALAEVVAELDRAREEAAGMGGSGVRRRRR